MKEIIRDLRSGIVAVIFSIFMYFWMIPQQIKVRKGVIMGPDYLPRFLIIIIGLCGMVLILRGLFFLKKRGELSVKVILGNNFFAGLKKYLPHIIFLLVSILYLLVMPLLGFILTSIPLLIFLLLYFGHSNFVRSVVTSVLFIVVVYLLFTYVFRIKFPIGPFGF
jgi:hypothetical protein